MIDTIISALQFIATIPSVGPVLAHVIGATGLLSGIASGIVAAWHGIVVAVQGLSAIPGLAKLSGLADKLKSYDDQAGDILNKYVLPILDRLSVLPLPSKN